MCVKSIAHIFWQVLTKDTGHSKELGFIPRELAQYVSPLIDNFQLRFEVIILDILWSSSNFFHFPYKLQLVLPLLLLYLNI